MWAAKTKRSENASTTGYFTGPACPGGVTEMWLWLSVVPSRTWTAYRVVSGRQEQHVLSHDLGCDQRHAQEIRRAVGCSCGAAFCAGSPRSTAPAVPRFATSPRAHRVHSEPRHRRVADRPPIRRYRTAAP